MPNPEYIKCGNLSTTGGCNNHEEAGENAGETPAIINQPWSCILANKPLLQQRCLGFERSQTEISVKPSNSPDLIG